MKATHKFKVGDKVRILPLAVKGGVSEKSVGKVGTITKYGRGDYFEVIMDKGQDTGPSPDLPWAVWPSEMEPVVPTGQQLLFSFMQQG